MALAVAVGACGGLRTRVPGLAPRALANLDEASYARKTIPTHRFRLPRAGEASDTTVIGAARRHRIRAGETLLDIARWYDLGYNEIVEANPGVDPFLPPVGEEILVPTEWVLPCCTYEGIVVNIPEMRLFYFRPSRDDPQTVVVHTYPVGLGRDDRRTPRGRFKVRGKTVNPRWDVPESIRREHIKDHGDARRSIPGGAPDNPLGKYRLQLTRRLYGIHGTDIPWGIGMQVTHGCVRLYPRTSSASSRSCRSDAGRVHLPAGQGGRAGRYHLGRGASRHLSLLEVARRRDAHRAREATGGAGRPSSARRRGQERRRRGRPGLRPPGRRQAPRHRRFELASGTSAAPAPPAG
jgi:lipoprotein-anchoring transpeptidase ErfK/SrfK